MRNFGTNNYSNNFEPQVGGLLDARTKINGPASNLLLANTWKSSDGNIWLPVGIRVSVTEDSDTTKNGVYMLLKEDYTNKENWLQLGANSGSSTSDVFVVDNIKFSVGTILDNYYRGLENLSTTNQIEELQDIISAYREGRPVVYADETNMDSTLRFGVLNVTMSDDSYPVTISVYNSNGDLISLSIDSFNAGEHWNVKIMTNTILSMSSYNLINPDRISTLNDGSISSIIEEYLKRLSNNTECIIIYRSNANRTLIVPLAITISDNKLSGTISYTLDNNTYNISLHRDNVNSSFIADPPIPQTTYLSTGTLLLERDTEIEMSESDTIALKKLFYGNNSVITNVVYSGQDSSGNQLIVPLNIYSDFGASEYSIYEVTYVEPTNKAVCNFQINQKEDGTLWASKIKEQGVYVSKLTLGKFYSIATGDTISNTDMLEMRRIWKLSNRGYTVMLSGGIEAYTNSDFSGALGPVQVSATGDDYNYPTYISIFFIKDTTAYIITTVSNTWNIQIFDISQLNNKGRMMNIGTGSVNMTAKTVTYTLTPNTYFGTGQYLFEAEIGFNGDTIKLSEVLNIRSYEGGNMTTTAVGSTLTTSVPIVIGYSSSNILVGFPSNLNITSLTSSKASSLTKL